MRLLLTVILIMFGVNAYSAEASLFAESKCKEAYEYHFLNRAISAKDVIGINLLIKGGANINGSGYKNYPNCVAGFEYSSPVMVAVSVKNIEIIETLLKAGANPSIKEGEGITPLFIAKNMAIKKLRNYSLIMAQIKTHNKSLKSCVHKAAHTRTKQTTLGRLAQPYAK